MKSKKQLESFVRYCEDHPSERFWQALRNWAKVSVIFTYSKEPDSFEWPIGLKDTFYL